MRTRINPVEAAEAVGMDAYDFDNLVRDQAARRLENLAARIRHGNESEDGDVEREHFDRVTEEVWRQVESAKALTEHWTHGADGETS